MSRQVFINGRFLTQRVTGVQRYATELVLALDRLQSANGRSTDPKLVLLAPHGARELPLQTIERRTVGPLSGNAWEQLTLPLATRGGLLLGLNATGPLLKSRQVITIHDASIRAVPQAFTWKFRCWYRLLLGVLVPRVPRVMTVSEFSKREIVRYFGCAAGKIQVGVEGAGHLDRLEPDTEVLRRNGLEPGRYVFAVSSPTANKNFGLIAEAIQMLGPVDFQIAIAGSNDAKVFGRARLPAGASIKAVGYVTDAELLALYRNAALFIYPSLYEGFGLPAVEAMASGCPVVASTAEAIVEVCGDAARYVSPHDPAALAAVIRELMADPDERRRMSDAGRARVDRYNWERAAHIVLSTLRELASPELQ